MISSFLDAAQRAAPLAQQEAAEIFNRRCELHAEDEAGWSVIATQMRREFESIEPLGDAETALWSATVNDTEGGLLSLC